MQRKEIDQQHRGERTKQDADRRRFLRRFFEHSERGVDDQDADGDANTAKRACNPRDLQKAVKEKGDQKNEQQHQ